MPMLMAALVSEKGCVAERDINAIMVLVAIVKLAEMPLADM